MKRTTLSRLHLPWTRLEPGQGFFVPCLDFDAVRRYGLKKAVSDRVFDAKAEAGIMDGLAGVFFFRPQRKTPRPEHSEPS